MARTVRFVSPRTVDIAEYKDPRPGPDEVLLATLYSGISAGTELTAYRGSNPHLTKRWEQERRLFLDDSAVTLEYPVEGWGYEEVGRVSEVGEAVTQVAVGDVVWGAWGHRSSVTVGEEWAAKRLLEKSVDSIYGIFSFIGAIALNGILDADIHVGEHVAVFGQGVPGLIVTQLAQLNGGTVIAIDGIERRLELAGKLGAEHTVDFTKQRPGEAVKSLTGDRGADVSIEFSGSSRGLHDAISSTAYNSRVVAAGFFQGEGAGLYLGEEFHHNRIEVVCSQISGVNPRLDHRWDPFRLQRTFMDLVGAGKVDLRPLISNTFPVEQAGDAFRLLDEGREEALQVVLEF